MSWIRCTALSLIAALYVLAGRWDFQRLSSVQGQAAPFQEPRLWLVMAGLVLGAVGLAHRACRPARPGETRNDPWLLGTLVGFFGYMCTSAIWAPDAGFALWKLYELVLVVVMTVSFGLAVLRQPAERVLNTFWGVTVGATSLLALVGVLTLLSSGGSNARLAVLGGGPNVFARLMGLFTLGCLFFWSRRGRAWIWIPMAATGVLLALLTGSRGGTTSIILAVLAFLVVGRIPLRRLAILAFLATAAVEVVTLFSPLGQALNHAVEERFLRLTLHYDGAKASETKVYLSGREDLYAEGWRLGLDNPVAGGGLAAFPALGLGVYPHNLFLEVFCEGGVVGLLFLASVIFAFLRTALRRRRSLDGATVGAVVLILIGSQSSGDLYDGRALYLLMVLTSFTSVAERRAVSASEPRSLSAGAAAPASPSLSYPAVHGAT